MSKLLHALFAGVLTLITVSASADGGGDNSPAVFLPGDYPTRPGDPGYHGGRIEALKKWDAMTSEQQAAAKKAARAKKQAELTQLDNTACDFCYSTARPEAVGPPITPEQREAAARKAAADRGAELKKQAE